MTIYIAGKMTGLPDLGKAKFDAAEKMLRDRGAIVLNPASLPRGMATESYMPICLAMVSVSDAVFALDNWEDSPGARIEVQYARYQRKPVRFESVDGAPPAVAIVPEYISRNEAILKCFDGWNNTPEDIAENLRKLPAANVRPVVTCSECIFGRRRGRNFCIGQRPDFFCANGKREEST